MDGYCEFCPGRPGVACPVCGSGRREDWIRGLRRWTAILALVAGLAVVPAAVVVALAVVGCK